MSLTPSHHPGARKMRLRFGVLAVLVAIAVGTVVFRQLEGWSILDSLYLTAQTVTTVGFGDIAPRTAAGRLFATFVDAEGQAIACTPGICLFSLDADIVWQVEFSAGIVVGF